jgi:hypothetical protein
VTPPPRAPLGPTLCAQAHVRLIDALYASGQYAEAEVALGAAVASDPAFKGLQEYKMIVKALGDAKQQAHA